MSDAQAFFDPAQNVANVKGNLPHWRQEGVVYFVTFRTADSIPGIRLRSCAAKGLPPLDFHDLLDAGYGECPLATPECRSIVERALRHFDGHRYALDEFVVAANHVHALLTPSTVDDLSAIVHSWKSFTALAINRLGGRRGTLWQKESFDHIVRGPDQLERIRKYIRGHAAWRNVQP